MKSLTFTLLVLSLGALPEAVLHCQEKPSKVEPRKRLNAGISSEGGARLESATKPRQPAN
jgi:hypothetical protein